MVEGESFFFTIVRKLFNPNKKTQRVIENLPPPVQIGTDENEAKRLKELQEKQLKDRNDNSRTQQGAGAYGGGGIPSFDSRDGSTLEQLAESNSLPPNTIENKQPL